MPSRQNDNALAQWIAEQQQASHLAQQHPSELHLHQHHHPAPQAAPDRRRELPHPLVTATYILMLSLALSLPLALIAAIVDAGNRPNVQYVQPSRGGW